MQTQHSNTPNPSSKTDIIIDSTDIDVDFRAGKVDVYHRYEWWHIVNDVIVGLWFVVGSFFFFYKGLTYTGTWFFELGSLEMLIGPAIRIGHRLRFRATGQTRTPDARASDVVVGEEESRDLDASVHKLEIRNRYELGHIVDEIMMALWFAVGSVFFFYDSLAYAGTWLFVCGSTQMLIGPVLRTSHKLHLRDEAPSSNESKLLSYRSVTVANMEIDIELAAHKVKLHHRYEWSHIGNDVFVALAFLIGSIFFFYASLTYDGTWLFVIGSADMLAGPVIRIAQKMHVKEIVSNNISF